MSGARAKCRRLALLLLCLGLAAPVARAQSQSGPIPAGLLNGQAASFVMGQENFSDITYGLDDKRWGAISGFTIVGNKLIVVDSSYLAPPNNNRVLIYNDLHAWLQRKPQDPLGNFDVLVGQTDLNSSTPGTSATQLFQPVAVASDGTRLLVAEWGNHRVLIYNQIPQGEGAAVADVVVGQPDFTSQGFGASPTSLRSPNGVATDGTRLFIADTLNNRVLIYNQIPTKNGAAASVVLGQPDFASSRRLPAAANTLYDPMSVTTDGQRLIVTDLGNNRVLIYNHIPTSSGQAADVAVGQPDFTSDGFGTTQTTLNFPRYAFSDGTRLVIVDSGNNRVLIYNQIPTQNGAAADVVLGQKDFLGLLESCGAAHFAVPFMAASAEGMLFVSDGSNRRILGFKPGADMVQSVVNGASFSAQPQVASCNVILPEPPVAPGGIAAIFGKNLANTTETAATTPLPTELGGVKVRVNGLEAPLFYASSTQINVQIPFEVKGFSASVEVEKQTPTGTVVSAAMPAGLTDGAPGVFTRDGTPAGPGAITHGDGSTVTDDNPAHPGETLVAYVTGLGTALQQLTTGAPVQFAATGAVAITGSSIAGIDLTISINGVAHTYTTVATDTLDTIAQAVTDAINNDEDPNVTAVADTVNFQVILNAKVVGPAGTDVFYEASSSNATQLSVSLPGTQSVPGTITFSGTPEPGQTVTINLAGVTDWPYTTVAGDTLDSVITNLAAAIENGDPNVSATADLKHQALLLTSRGDAGLGISFTVSVSQDATFSATSSRQFLAHTPVSVTNTVTARIGESLPLVPGDIFIAGSPEPGQTLSLTLGDTSYSYTVVEGDTLASIVTNMTELVNADPNVVATADTTQLSIALALRVPTTNLQVTIRAELTGSGALFVLVRSTSTTGSTFAGVTFAGPVEGLVGLYQVNFTVPSDATADPATKLTVIQNQIIFGSVTQFDILSNIVTFPVATP